jgi:EAL domain-containing protein (putative c-di-GMP-specific phosphodiesterase class I)
VALTSNAGVNRGDLVRKAGIALYHAKSNGRNCFRVFHREMDRSIQEKHVIEAALRQALERGDQLQVHYQPIFAGTNQDQLVSVEALLRWTNPELGILSPTQFIPIAEDSGLIHPIGEWVLKSACLAALDWPIGTVAVNVSPVQFRAAGFPEKVVAILRETGFPPGRLELEVTEGVLIEGGTQVLKALRAAGVRIALDDFGTGYSSLNYLGRYAVDRIKIDKSFVDPIEQKSDARAIVVAMVDLARAMDIEITAEGVETFGQSKFLSEIGCDQLQGFLFSKAVSATAIQDLLLRNTVAKLRLANGNMELHEAASG